jgi:ferric-dicitrate binding protein FerR (iron transport regulator)
VSGAVKMNAADQSTLLQPGHAITYTPSNGMQISSFDADRLLSWRQGLYLFNNMPLADILKVFPRWYGKEVIIDNPIRKDVHFTGVINRNLPVNISLDLLKGVSDFKYTIEGDVIHIK